MATAHASLRSSQNCDGVGESRSTSLQRSSRSGDNVGESRCHEYDNILPTTTSSRTDVSAEMSTSGRFVSNTLVTLSPATVPSLMAGAPPRTRTTMREMQGSDGYVSFTSPEDLPVCPPLTAVRQRVPTPAEDVEKEWKQIVFAAETVVNGDQCVDDISDTSLELLPVCADSVDSDCHHMMPSFGGKSFESSVLPSTQPLSFANPLFLYRSSSRPSPGGSVVSLDSSVIQKSYSLSSVFGSNSVESPPTVGGRGTPVAVRNKSPGAGATAVQAWKPSQSNGCLADSMGMEGMMTRYNEVVSTDGPSTSKPLGVGSVLSRSTELPASSDTDQSRHSSAVMGLDTPPDSPQYSSRYQRASPGSRKATPSQNNVRMGVRSMHRRPIEQDKSKIEVSTHTVSFIIYRQLIRVGSGIL